MKLHLRAAVSILLAAVLLLSAAPASGAEAIGETIESYTLEGGAAESLDFLAGYTNLRSLTLINCPAMDLSPLASCGKLSELSILWHEGFESGGAYDLSPLGGCARLRTLTLEGACAGDLAPLISIQNLSMLSVKSLGGVDYTPIAKLGLKHLLLYGAPGEQVAAVFAAAGKTLVSAAIGDCALTPEANAAIFGVSRLTSLRFERAEGVSADAQQWRKLKKLTTLSISDCALPDLAFLSDYVASVIVMLDGVRIGGAACSVHFDKYFLETDNVPSAAMLSFLNGSGRRWLYAAVRTETETVSKEVIAALAGLDSLLSLDVQAVSADAWDASVWAGCKRLEQLKLSDCGAVPLGFLEQMRVLERLTVTGTELTGAVAIGGLYRLKQLSLRRCTVDDWAFLSNLPELELLSVADCGGPDTVSFTADMPKLATLVLEDAPLADLTPLTGRRLSLLSLYGCPVADYAPLKALPALSLLACSESAALPALTCRVTYKRLIAAE